MEEGKKEGRKEERRKGKKKKKGRVKGRSGGRSSIGFCGFHALPCQCHQNNDAEIAKPHYF